MTLTSRWVGPPRIRYDEELRTLRLAVQLVVQQYLTPLVQQAEKNVAARCALLADVGPLGSFFGRKMANDFLLPLLITTLNDRSWELRATFFQHIAGVATCVPTGVVSTETKGSNDSVLWSCSVEFPTA